MSELLQLGSPNARPKAPRADELELKFSEQGVQELEALISHYPTKKACILPALWLAQREYGGYLSGPAIAEVAHRLGRSYAEVEGVATFYTLYNTAHQPGRHKLELCTCLSCMVNGAYDLRDYITQKLGIKHGETSADGEWTFEEVECLNACDRAVVMQVGDEYYGPLDREKIDALLDELKANPQATTVKYANAVVRVQLRAEEAPVS
ncbi:MAG: NAD(P)H-dependent oxidoreductase subunit E [Fimbriimonadaceae bacterium]|nr:NAD(P)H-dependent oxidoreductase subunit E [Fimbriimonadaceae bacterium]